MEVRLHDILPKMRVSNLPPACSQKMHPQAREGIWLLNRGAYFKAHEALESAWKQESGPVRDLYRGILQAAVVYLHIERGNYAGAVKVYQRCLKWLRPWSPYCQGICVDSLLADLAVVIEEVRNLGPDHIGEFDLNQA